MLRCGESGQAYLISASLSWPELSSILLFSLCFFFFGMDQTLTQTRLAGLK